MARKSRIQTGDWVLTGTYAFLVDEVGDGVVSDFRCDTFRTECVTKLPASPADMARSHLLLMRWWKTGRVGGSAVKYDDAVEAMSNHCRRLAKTRGKK